MGTIRNFLRRKKQKSDKDQKIDTKNQYKKLIVDRFYEILDNYMKFEIYRKDPKKLFIIVNSEWNKWIKEQLKALENDIKNRLIFKSVVESAVLLINKDFQERKEKLLRRTTDGI